MTITEFFHVHLLHIAVSLVTERCYRILSDMAYIYIYILAGGQRAYLQPCHEKW